MELSWSTSTGNHPWHFWQMASIPDIETYTWPNLNLIVQVNFVNTQTHLLKKNSGVKHVGKTLQRLFLVWGLWKKERALSLLHMEYGVFSLHVIASVTGNCTDCSSLLMLLCLVRKFTANLESSNFQTGRWSFRSRMNWLSSGYPAGEIRISQACTPGDRQPRCAHVLRHWAETCFWLSLTCWVTLREEVSLLPF